MFRKDLGFNWLPATQVRGNISEVYYDAIREWKKIGRNFSNVTLTIKIAGFKMREESSPNFARAEEIFRHLSWFTLTHIYA